jgi:hypothetical protein
MATWFSARRSRARAALPAPRFCSSQAETGQGRLDERLLGRQLGAVGQCRGNKRINLGVDIDHGELQMGRFDGLDARLRLQTQETGQLGAGQPPLFAGAGDGEAAPRQLGARARHLDGLQQPLGQLLREPDQLLGAAHRILSGGPFAARLLHGEIGIRDRDHDVVRGGVHAEPARIGDLPGCQGGIQGIGERERGRRPAAGKQRLLARPQDVADHVLQLPIVPVISDAELE